MAILGTSEAMAVGLAFAAIVLVHIVKQANANANRKLPPGPKGVPFFGNLFQAERAKRRQDHLLIFWIYFPEMTININDSVYPNLMESFL